MSIIRDPDTGQYYSDDGTDPPVDPQTGKPLGLPPNVTWGDAQPGQLDVSPGGPGYNVNPPSAPGFDPTWGGYAGAGDLTNNLTTQLGADPAAQVAALASKYGIAPGETDAANLAAKNPGDRAAYLSALDAQYKLRAGSHGGVPAGASSGAGAGTSGTGGALGAGTPNAFGAPPAPFSETYQTLARPSYLQGQYTPPTWGETFKEPTQADLEASPGYLAGANAIQRGMERGAAAHGSILSGGFVGRTLPRALSEYAGSAFQNLHNNAFASYQQRYGAFGDRANRDIASRQLNENTFQTDVGNNRNAYLTRYQGYLDQVTNTRNAEDSWWNRENGLNTNGLNATTAGRPA